MFIHLNIADFFTLSDPLIRNVVIGSVLLAVSGAMVGIFTLLRKRALVGDAVSHAILPGVCLAFILHGTKNPVVLLMGAFITGWLSLVVIDFLSRKTKISEDTSIGLVLSTFFAFGTVLLSFIQGMDHLPDKTGLNHFLFGSAIAISNGDLVVFGSVSLLLILMVIVFYKAFFVLSFDESYTQSIGYPVKLLRLTLTSLTVLAVVVGIQAVGVILMAAMLITPAATARFWTNSLRLMMVLAVLFGAFSGLTGAYGSYITNAPTGPWMVMVLSGLAIGSFLFAPRRGILSRLIRQNRFRRQIQEENILKAMYQLGEREERFSGGFSVQSIQERRPMESRTLTRILSRLEDQGFIHFVKDHWELAPEGKARGRRLVKLHRLWEVYLTKYLRIAPDHVHDDADTIEHIITPELEARLEEFLNFPERDPHESAIPYKS